MCAKGKEHKAAPEKSTDSSRPLKSRLVFCNMQGVFCLRPHPPPPPPTLPWAATLPGQVVLFSLRPHRTRRGNGKKCLVYHIACKKTRRGRNNKKKKNTTSALPVNPIFASPPPLPPSPNIGPGRGGRRAAFNKPLNHLLRNPKPLNTKPLILKPCANGFTPDSQTVKPLNPKS